MGANTSSGFEADAKNAVVHREPVHGFKGFGPGMNCLGFQYEIGKTYEVPEQDLAMCKAGFHFCRNAIDVFQYYSDAPANGNLFAHVVGETLTYESTSVAKLVTCKITIGDPITAAEMRETTPPVIARADGQVELYKAGLLHSTEGPAILGPNSTEYYEEGLRHRIGGPALKEKQSGLIAWYEHGKLIKTEPNHTVVESDGWIHHYEHGVLHRADGPAIYNEKEGIQIYCREGCYHREDGPAYIGPYGSCWMRNHAFHREDGPAIDMQCVQMWYQFGQWHNPKGPAVVKLCECHHMDNVDAAVGHMFHPSKVGIDYALSVLYFLEGAPVSRDYIEMMARVTAAPADTQAIAV